MKKFSKILILLFSFIFIVTAFTVVALAEEAIEKTAPVVLTFTSTDGTSTTDVFDFQGFADGAEILDNDTKLGGWYVYTSDNGENKYVASQKYSESGTRTVDRWDIEIGDSNHTIATHPVFAFDFDVMSPTGSYEAVWGNAYLAVQFSAIAGTTVRPITGSKNFIDLELSNVPYEWQHITLIVSYVGNNNFVSRFFKNGVEIENSYIINTFDILAGATNTYVEYVCVSPLLTNITDNMLCMDNLRFTYYTDAYSVEEIATYVYDEDYELPYGRTVASIIAGDKETKYDNIEEALALANKDNTLKLHADTTCVIDKAINVDANGFAFNYTGANFVDVNADANIYELRHAGEVYLTDVWFNLSYYSSFKYNLYLPANDTLQINSVSWGEGAEVYMNETKYFVYTYDATTTGAADLTEVVVNYTVDGNTYTQTYELSALVYATLALPDTTGELETKAVSNMVRYIKEARLQAKLEVVDKDYADLIAGATEYQTTYDDLGASYAELDGVEIGLALNGTTVAYYVKFSDATDVTASIDGKSIDVELIDGRWYTKAARVYDIVLNKIEITVTKADSLVVTGTYSVGAYINESNNTLAKAMYEFGVAAAAYKASITG